MQPAHCAYIAIAMAVRSTNYLLTNASIYQHYNYSISPSLSHPLSRTHTLSTSLSLSHTQTRHLLYIRYAESKAGIGTYTNAFRSKFDSIARFMRCRGNHTTCDVCINVNLLLRDPGRHWPPAADDVIKSWRHLHLQQQWREREDAALREGIPSFPHLTHLSSPLCLSLPLSLRA